MYIKYEGLCFTHAVHGPYPRHVYVSSSLGQCRPAQRESAMVCLFCHMHACFLATCTKKCTSIFCSSAMGQPGAGPASLFLTCSRVNKHHSLFVRPGQGDDIPLGKLCQPFFISAIFPLIRLSALHTNNPCWHLGSVCESQPAGLAHWYVWMYNRVCWEQQQSVISWWWMQQNRAMWQLYHCYTCCCLRKNKHYWLIFPKPVSGVWCTCAQMLWGQACSCGQLPCASNLLVAVGFHFINVSNEGKKKIEGFESF